MREEEEMPRPAKTLLQPPVLDPLSIEALREYVVALREEIERVEAVIARKESARGLADSFFRRPG